MVKRGFFEGETDQLQDFLNLFYRSNGMGDEIPEIEEGMTVCLRVKEDNQEEVFHKWASGFGLKCTIVESTK